MPVGAKEHQGDERRQSDATQNCNHVLKDILRRALEVGADLEVVFLIDSPSFDRTFCQGGKIVSVSKQMSATRVVPMFFVAPTFTITATIYVSLKYIS